jgi:hypothetical protein
MVYFLCVCESNDCVVNKNAEDALPGLLSAQSKNVTFCFPFCFSITAGLKNAGTSCTGGRLLKIAAFGSLPISSGSPLFGDLVAVCRKSVVAGPRPLSSSDRVNRLPLFGVCLG